MEFALVQEQQLRFGGDKMKKYYKGQYIEMTAEEIAERQKDIPATSYEQRVINRIRERYSVDDELALLRQRVLKADEFEEYFDFVEKVKAEERAREV